MLNALFNVTDISILEEGNLVIKRICRLTLDRMNMLVFIGYSFEEYALYTSIGSLTLWL